MSANISQSPGGQAPLNKPTSFADVIRSIEIRLSTYGPGPHTDKQKEEIKNLNLLLTKTREQAKLVGQKMEPSMQGASASQGTSSAPAAGGLPTAGTSTHMFQPAGAALGSSAQAPTEPKVLDKKRLQELIREVDPMEQLEDDVEEALVQIADDFIDNVVNSACELAKHRKSDTLEVKDVQLYLDRAWNMWIPGFGSDDLRPYKKAPTTEAHKQRVALIKKTMKKY